MATVTATKLEQQRKLVELAERRLELERRRLATASKAEKVAASRAERRAAGEAKARDTRRKVLLGVAAIRLLDGYDAAARARVCERLAANLSLTDQAVVADILGLDLDDLAVRIAAAGPAAHRVQGGNSHA